MPGRSVYSTQFRFYSAKPARYIFSLLLRQGKTFCRKEPKAKRSMYYVAAVGVSLTGLVSCVCLPETALNICRAVRLATRVRAEYFIKAMPVTQMS